MFTFGSGILGRAGFTDTYLDGCIIFVADGGLIAFCSSFGCKLVREEDGL
jgi:hypothetical protein